MTQPPDFSVGEIVLFLDYNRSWQPVKILSIELRASIYLIKVLPLHSRNSFAFVVPLDFNRRLRKCNYLISEIPDLRSTPR